MNAYLQDSPGGKGPGITRGGDRGVDRPGAEQLYGDDRGQAGVTRIHGPRVASQLASEAGYADSRDRPRPGRSLKGSSAAPR